MGHGDADAAFSCEFSVELPATFLANCTENCTSFPNYKAAMEACIADLTCGGITSGYNGEPPYVVRFVRSFVPSFPPACSSFLPCVVLLRWRGVRTHAPRASLTADGLMSVCGGVIMVWFRWPTLCRWQLRSGNVALKSPHDESSYRITNLLACRGAVDEDARARATAAYVRACQRAGRRRRTRGRNRRGGGGG